MVDICRYTALILIIGTKTYGSERHFCFVLFIYLFVCVGGGGGTPFYTLESCLRLEYAVCFLHRHACWHFMGCY